MTFQRPFELTGVEACNIFLLELRGPRFAFRPYLQAKASYLHQYPGLRRRTWFPQLLGLTHRQWNHSG